MRRPVLTRLGSKWDVCNSDSDFKFEIFLILEARSERIDCYRKALSQPSAAPEAHGALQRALGATADDTTEGDGDTAASVADNVPSPNDDNDVVGHSKIHVRYAPRSSMFCRLWARDRLTLFGS